MTALKISDIATFTNSLFLGQLFDKFLLREATISTGSTFTIDGSINESFYSPEELEEAGLSGLKYMPFIKLRPVILNMIKGNKKPIYFKFDVLLSPTGLKNTVLKAGSSYSPDDIAAIGMNITYKNDTLICTTGISYKIFSLDKSLEQEWDRLVKLFFKQNNIMVEEL